MASFTPRQSERLTFCSAKTVRTTRAPAPHRGLIFAVKFNTAFGSGISAYRKTLKIFAQRIGFRFLLTQKEAGVWGQSPRHSARQRHFRVQGAKGGVGEKQEFFPHSPWYFTAVVTFPTA